jgi:hypothetical protein
MTERCAYPGDLSDARWELIVPVLSAWRFERRGRSLGFGRPPRHDLREIMNAIAPGADRDVVAEALRRSAPHRPHYRQRVVWALEENPRLLTGEGYPAPHRAILRFIELLHEAGVAGMVRPSCPRCRRDVRIDKPLDGQRVCRNRIAKSRIEECVRCGARREPAIRDDQGRPLCPNCLATDPANVEVCINCGKRRRVQSRTPNGPLCPNCCPLPVLVCSICGRTAPGTHSRLTGLPWQRATAGDWGSYAAEVSRRNSS